jgi:Uma2 family endonuclease
MTTVLTRSEASPKALTDPVPYLWTRAKYEEAVKRGLFTTNDKIELIEGKIVQKMPQNTPHATALTLTQQALQSAFSSGHTLRIQLPLSADDLSQPEPDLAVVVGPPRDYLAAHPTSDKTVLVVEISDSTLRFDQTGKAAMYARAGIGDYWIVNLPEQVLEVFRTPVGDAYTEMRRLTRGEIIAPLAASETRLAVADLLP